MAALAAVLYLSSSAGTQLARSLGNLPRLLQTLLSGGGGGGRPPSWNGGGGSGGGGGGGGSGGSNPWKSCVERCCSDCWLNVLLPPPSTQLRTHPLLVPHADDVTSSWRVRPDEVSRWRRADEPDTDDEWW